MPYASDTCWMTRLRVAGRWAFSSASHHSSTSCLSPNDRCTLFCFWWGGGLPDDIAHGAGAARARWGNE
eukprot:scaffold2675_cov236-Pinguiococcus_pyrenoidosus.AAC.2